MHPFRYRGLMTLIIIFVLSSGLFAWNGQTRPDSIETIINEDFEGGFIPAGWTMTTESDVGWYVTNDGSSQYLQIPDHTTYAVSNDDAAGDDGSMDYLIMPPIPPTVWDSLYLEFDSFFVNNVYNTATVEVSTDGGNWWQTVRTLVPNSQWTHIYVDLRYWGTVPDTVLVAFHSDDGGEDALGWAIDNVVLIGRVSTSVDDGDIPPQPGVELALANPYHVGGQIACTLKKPGQLEVAIFNIRGQRIRELLNGYHASGAHTVSWDGKDSGGRMVSSGVYLVRAVSQGGQKLRKVLLVR